MRTQVRIGGRFNDKRANLGSFIRKVWGERYGARLVKVTWEGDGWFKATISTEASKQRNFLLSARPEWTRL